MLKDFIKVKLNKDVHVDGIRIPGGVDLKKGTRGIVVEKIKDNYYLIELIDDIYCLGVIGMWEADLDIA